MPASYCNNNSDVSSSSKMILVMVEITQFPDNTPKTAIDIALKPYQDILGAITSQMKKSWKGLG
uniref:Uncharacterized protein n=1 Tax=Octopus bimaculoides TaxID=37653 RepID=A0A0L8H4K6_OCTBM